MLATTGPTSARARNVLGGLLADGRRGWYLLVRDAQVPASGYADAFLVGTGGVFGLVFDDDLPEASGLHDIETHAELLFSDLPVGNNRNVFVPETIELVLVTAPHARIRPRGDIRLVSEVDYQSLFKSEARLDRGVSGRIAEMVSARDRGYTLLSLDEPAAQKPSDDVGLIDPERLLEDERAQALGKPFPTWMTFLDPAQRALVARNYNGPARIAGPAGTGKTVVALHRMARRARKTTGKLLFTTFVKNLPKCQERAFVQLAPPDVMDRTEFTNLHSWAREFMKGRGEPYETRSPLADNAFNLAWSRVGSRGPLAEIEPDNRYWRDEVDRLIKGRGIHDFDEYAKLDRRGRHGKLQGSAKKAVWDLFYEYEQIRQRQRFLDSNDLIANTLIELRKNPLDELYDMVVVDEVQDMSVLGLRLVHALTGDAPNALLLVGDGQQKIYAGEWKLSDAGIPIVGRGELLRVNYRNCDVVLALAASLEGRTRVDDLDGDAGIALSRSETVLRGGVAETWSGSDEEVEEQIRLQLKVIAARGIPLSATALLTLTNQETKRYCAALRRWDVRFQNLEDYVGVDQEVLKIGTVYRAKGLDFRAVLHPFNLKSLPAEPLSDAGRDRADLVTNQRFVAITRAREYVWLGQVQG
ncbi:UvrD-helicase domain-containing protein [Nocardia sp. NPDC059240]|uniref:UvrD-helicase domain-containing protein n=1 Tax=Nocardia sp. NPDC059240 TaxID=3346786 RepID=UPI0036CFB649